MPASKSIIGLSLALLLFLPHSPRLKAEPQPIFHTLASYKPNYVMNSWFLDHEGSEQGYDDRELLLQFSFKKRIYKVFYFGFTYRGFWQVYDLSTSRSFRDENYNPEGFLEFSDAMGLDTLRLGLAEHESNGERTYYNEEGEEVNYSRTWDRSYLYLWKNLVPWLGTGVKLWVVTSPKRGEFRAYYDDNPDMQEYMGSGELYLSLGRFPTQLSFMFRRGWKEDTETCRIEGRLPLYLIFGGKDGGTDLYLMVFNGYGDSLIDYNRRIKRVAIGVSFR